MSTALATVQEKRELTQPESSYALNFTKEELDLIKADICKGATDAELRMFLAKCKRTGLDPFLRQIYSIKRYQSNEGGGGGYVHQTQVSIDGARLTADRSGRYEGQLGPFYCGPDAVWREVWLESAPPAAAKVGVLKTGMREPIFATARFSSYAQTKKDGSPNSMWAKMPDTMLAKCAEMLALRKAFPMELGGCYAAEEMGQIDNGAEFRNEPDPEAAKLLSAIEGLARRVFKTPEEWSEYLGDRNIENFTAEALSLFGAELKKTAIERGILKPPAPATGEVVEAKVEEKPAPVASRPDPKKPTAKAVKHFWTQAKEKLTIDGSYIGNETFYWWLESKALAPFDDVKERVSVSLMSAEELSVAVEMIAHANPEKIVADYKAWAEDSAIYD